MDRVSPGVSTKARTYSTIWEYALKGYTSGLVWYFKNMGDSKETDIKKNGQN